MTRIPKEHVVRKAILTKLGRDDEWIAKDIHSKQLALCDKHMEPDGAQRKRRHAAERFTPAKKHNCIEGDDVPLLPPCSPSSPPPPTAEQLTALIDEQQAELRRLQAELAEEKELARTWAQHATAQEHYTRAASEENEKLRASLEDALRAVEKSEEERRILQKRKSELMAEKVALAQENN
eukprot:comp24333_c4_seq7/m.46055 comp24333_c4_seq7/g.46055  ORF comp24333_c4_seq7/g.46055 comp24333_c4_seq7/m.46055 type:complete len:180 (-) comp24333_c4_seq7:82-621(-)